MMVSPCPKECSIVPHPLRDLESQRIGVEADGPLQIRDLEVNVTDNRCRIYGARWRRLNLVAHGSRAFRGRRSHRSKSWARAQRPSA